MTVTVGSFRATFPRFNDTNVYPDASVNFYLSLATNSLPAQIWGDRLDFGVALYVAHFLLVNSPKPGVNGGQVTYDDGFAKGLVTSKSVQGVSKSMDLSIGQTDGGGSFNLTTYGQQYLTLLDSVGIGVVQL